VTTICGCAAPAQEGPEAEAPAKAEYRWRSGDFFPTQSSVGYRAIETFAAVSEQLSKGNIDITIRTGGVLGGSEELVDSVSRGELEFCSASPYSGFHELQNLKGIPFAGSTWEDYDALFYGDGIIREMIADSWEAIGCKFLMRLSYGPMCYCNNVRSIETPEDFDGLKIRMPPSDVYVKTFERMAPGGIGQVIAWSEVYSSLERGVVDGTPMYMHTYRDQKFYEVAPYFTDINQCYIWDDYLINLDLWNSLSEDTQSALLEAAGRAEDFCRFAFRTEYDLVQKQLTERGAEFTNLTDAQRQVFIDNANPPELWGELYKDLLEEYYPGEDMYDKLVDAVEEVS
jgi:TRAP-type C4-dicarboxylate transport system substrate-binding protein